MRNTSWHVRAPRRLAVVFTLAALAPFPAVGQRQVAASGSTAAALTEALADPSPGVRAAAARSLGSLEDRRAVFALADALEKERVAHVRHQIVHALGEIKDVAAVSALSFAAYDTSITVRLQVAYALGEINDERGIPTLLDLVQDADAGVRVRAAHALKEFSEKVGMNPTRNFAYTESMLDAFVDLASDNEAQVRVSAAGGLGQLKGRRALDALVRMLNDSSTNVRRAAAMAMSEISGRPY